MSPDTVFRDPYLLDLLGLKGAYSERDLESAILREIEGVLLELGTGFAFVARQKRMSVGKDDFPPGPAVLPPPPAPVDRRRAEAGVLSSRPTSARWSCTCAGWTSTNGRRAKKRRSA
jgi:hypothetical protein